MLTLNNISQFQPTMDNFHGKKDNGFVGQNPIEWYAIEYSNHVRVHCESLC